MERVEAEGMGVYICLNDERENVMRCLCMAYRASKHSREICKEKGTESNQIASLITIDNLPLLHTPSISFNQSITHIPKEPPASSRKTLSAQNRTEHKQNSTPKQCKAKIKMLKGDD